MSAATLSDSFLESILRECGPIKEWKRNKDEKGISVSLGTVEFENIMGVIKAMKIIKNKEFKGKKLDVKIGSKPEKLIGILC